MIRVNVWQWFGCLESLHTGKTFQQSTLLKAFSYFYQKNGINISCKSSPKETVCMKYQTQFLGQIKKSVFAIYWIYPEVLIVMVRHKQSKEAILNAIVTAIISIKYLIVLMKFSSSFCFHYLYNGIKRSNSTGQLGRQVLHSLVILLLHSLYLIG